MDVTKVDEIVVDVKELEKLIPQYHALGYFIEVLLDTGISEVGNPYQEYRLRIYKVEGF